MKRIITRIPEGKELGEDEILIDMVEDGNLIGLATVRLIHKEVTIFNSKTMILIRKLNMFKKMYVFDNIREQLEWFNS